MSHRSCIRKWLCWCGLEIFPEVWGLDSNFGLVGRVIHTHTVAENCRVPAFHSGWAWGAGRKFRAIQPVRGLSGSFDCATHPR